MESMPTGFFIRYHSDNGFQPVLSQKFGYEAMQWLEYVAKRDNIFIERGFNGGERKIGSRHIFVEGFVPKRTRFFNFMDVIGMVTLLLWYRVRKFLAP